MVRMWFVACLFLLVFTLPAMESSRILGAVVAKTDKQKMRPIISRDDIQEGEIVAVYCKNRRDAEWRYAQITSYLRNEYNFVGLVAFQPDNVLKAWAVDFKEDVRKLSCPENPTDHEKNEQKSAGQRLCNLLELLLSCACSSTG